MLFAICLICSVVMTAAAVVGFLFGFPCGFACYGVSACVIALVFLARAGTFKDRDDGDDDA